MDFVPLVSSWASTEKGLNNTDYEQLGSGLPKLHPNNTNSDCWEINYVVAPFKKNAKMKDLTS